MQPASSPEAAVADPGAWASSLGERWKYLQSNLASESAETRQVLLEEEMRRALSAVPAAKRGACLDALAAKYPQWELAAVSLNAPASAARMKPDEVIAAFLNLVPQLNAEQREALKKQLAVAGLMQSTPAPLEGDALTDIQAKLKLDTDDKIDPQRLGKLFALYAEAMLILDQLAWNLWKTAAPKSAIKRDTTQGDLRMATRRALTGDTNVTPAVIHKQLEASRLLVAGLLAGLGPAGKNFSRRYTTTFAPDAVRAALEADGGGKGDAQLWKKYTELAAQLSETVIEDDVQEAVVKYAEELIRGSSK